MKIRSISTIYNDYIKLYPNYICFPTAVQDILYANLHNKQKLLDLNEKGITNRSGTNNEEKIFNSEFNQSLERDQKREEKQQKDWTLLNPFTAG